MMSGTDVSWEASPRSVKETPSTVPLYSQASFARNPTRALKRFDMMTIAKLQRGGRPGS